MQTRIKKDQRRPVARAASRYRRTKSTDSAQVDQRSVNVRQGRLMQGINDSPMMTLQRKQLARSIGDPVQRVEDEEELLQGKFGTVQRQEALEEEELLQGKFESVQRQGMEDEELLQGKFSRPLQDEQQEAPAPNQTGMPDDLKSGIESLSGVDVSDVRVHYSSSRPAQLSAHAYAQGNDIHLASGQEKHLPHEAWHVVQQLQGRVQPTMQVAGERVNNDAALEHEADVMGEKAAKGGAE